MISNYDILKYINDLSSPKTNKRKAWLRTRPKYYKWLKVNWKFYTIYTFIIGQPVKT